MRVRGAVLGIALHAAGAASAATIRVPADEPTIAAGIAAAERGDVVEVACGTYYEHDLHMKSGVTLRGAAASADCVTVDALGQGRGFLVDQCDSTTVIEGLTIRGGAARFDNGRGGGMWIVASSPRIRECLFTACEGPFGTVNVQNGAAAPLFVDCRFDGGATGIHSFEDTNISVLRCVFVGTGVAIHYTGVVRLTRCTFISAGVGSIHTTSRIVAERCLFYNTTVDVDSMFCCQTGSTNPRFCTPGGPDYHVQTDSPCLITTGTCTGIIGAYGAGCGPAAAVPVTISTEPPGSDVAVDGVVVSTPAVRSWLPGSEHSVAVDPVLHPSATARWRFGAWSDGGARVHDAFVLPGMSMLTAALTRQYRVRTMTVAEPGAGGHAAPVDSWVDENTSLELVATPRPGSTFTEWIGSGSGSYTGTDNPATIVAQGPIVQRAGFVPVGYEFTVSASDTDPYVDASDPTGTLRPLYLWLTCARGGLSAFEARVTGTLPLLGFVPAPGVLNAGAGDHLLLAVSDCPSGLSVHRLLGTIWVQDVGGDLCLGPPAGGPVAAVDCGDVIPNLAEDPGVAGFASLGSPCGSGTSRCAGFEPPGQGPRAATPARERRSLLESVHPNPLTGSCTVAFTTMNAGRVRVDVFDVTGRRIANILDAHVEVGRHDVVWDGRSAEGRSAPAGIYFLRVITVSGTETARVVRLAGR